jgi:hypothetical protein
MSNWRKHLTRLLLAFIFVSVGYAVGKQLHGGGMPGDDQLQDQAEVTVYYMHGTPCVTCIRVKEIAAALVQREFADELAAGRMRYLPLNYQEPRNKHLAERFNVGHNMIIVHRTYAPQVSVEPAADSAVITRTAIERQVRLDEVLRLARDTEKLEQYIRQGIRRALDDGGPQ